MKITLEMLKDKGANEMEMQRFEEFYLQKNQKEIEILELLHQGFTESPFSAFYSPVIYKCIDNATVLKNVIKFHIQNKDTINLFRTEKYCQKLLPKFHEELKNYFAKYHFPFNDTLESLSEMCAKQVNNLSDLQKILDKEN